MRKSLECWVADSVQLPAYRNGPLDGITVALKDLFAVQGHVASFGFAAWRSSHEPASAHAPAVVRLLDAGASITGLTKMDQLAYSLIGNAGEGTPPINPRFPNRFTGGSSSGTASAVAGAVADLGIGTDTAGSIRVPAAACGLFGLRPTHGVISVTGVLPLARSFDVVGLLTRDPDVLALAFEALQKRPAQPVGIQQVVVASGLTASTATVEAVTAVASSTAEFLGVPLIERDTTDFVNAEVGDLFARIQAREIWNEHASWIEGRESVFTEDVRARLERASKLCAASDSEIRADLVERSCYAEALSRFLPAGSVLVLPVLPGLSPLRDASAKELLTFRVGAFQLSAPSSLSGRPQLVVPAATDEGPLGVGVIAGPNEETALISLAQNLRRASGLLAE